jgi:hypothetical protein
LSALPATTKQSPAIEVVSKVLEIIFVLSCEASVWEIRSVLSASSSIYTYKMEARLLNSPITHMRVATSNPRVPAIVIKGKK